MKLKIIFSQITKLNQFKERNVSDQLKKSPEI